MKKILLAPALSAALVAAPAAASDIDTINLLSQSEFRLLSEDLGAALSFKPLLPAEALGITGFDVGVAVTGTNLKSAELLSKASGGESMPSTLPVPTLRLHKGLPLNIDVGLAYASVPDVGVRYTGGEVRWAFVPGNVALPAVAVRGSLTRLSGIDQLKFDTKSLDISVSKGFAMLTPYAGVGQVWVKSTPQGIPSLSEESFTQEKIFAGLNVNLGLVNFAFEADRTGGIASYGGKFGLRF
jgi:hypothetical protein